MRNAVRLVRNGRVIRLSEIRPDLTLIDYLRLVERATGTKASCEEGACGACTVAVGKLKGGKLVYQTVNACSVLVAQLDGCEVVTIEDIAEDDGTLHPVQEALVEEHATQCGFCTPGMAMSLFVLHQSTEGAIAEEDVRGAIQGNLCRCTGYRSVVAAGAKAGARRRATRIDRLKQETTRLLGEIADGEDFTLGAGEQFVAAPTNLDRAAAILDRHPEAEIISGSPAVSARRGRATGKSILLSRVPELKRIEDGAAELVLGGAVTLLEAYAPLASLDRDIGTMIRRIGGPQERATATVADCILAEKNRSILPTILLALGAEAVFLRDGRTRKVPIAEIYAESGEPNPELGRMLVEIHIPRPKPGGVFRAYAVGDRWDMSPAIVAGAFKMRLGEDGKIAEASLAFAGLSAVPKRSPGAEAALIGYGPLERSVWPTAFAAMRADFAGGSAERSGARYRTETAQALLGKALIEAGGSADSRTRLRGFRDTRRNAAG